ncbi:ATP-binding protein [Actinophytocola sp.]|uniref:ATP-binding protein n=1 Tax=Actinophytocola sp. TaxID=1872138 RepID=UPI0025C1B894|nr:ATP-binding protein [Actinophytocola sp.]
MSSLRLAAGAVLPDSAHVDADALTHTEVRLPESHRSAALAREFTRTTLTGWGHQSWQDAAQVVSELVSNVLLHAHGQPVVRLVEVSTGIRVEVSDDSPRPPTVLRSGHRGLGMRLVERLSTAWGVSRRGRGKVVWCDLPATPTPIPNPAPA